MAKLFSDEPTGCLAIPSLNDALERILELERKVEAIESDLKQFTKK